MYELSAGSFHGELLENLPSLHETGFNPWDGGVGRLRGTHSGTNGIQCIPSCGSGLMEFDISPLCYMLLLFTLLHL